MTRTRSRWLVLVAGLFLSSSAALGQVTAGTPLFGSFSGGPDIVDNANLNVHFGVPVVQKAGLIPFYYVMTYDSSVWYPVGSVGSQVWLSVPSWGWRTLTPLVTGEITFNQIQASCHDLQGNWYYYHEYNNFAYIDPTGVAHPAPVSQPEISDYYALGLNGTNKCHGSGWAGSASPYLILDDYGYTITVGIDTNDFDGYDFYPKGTVTTRAGSTIAPYVYNVPYPPTSTLTDTNSNQIQATTSNGTTTFTDSLGYTVLTVNASNNTLTYYGQGGVSEPPVSLTYTTKTVKTNFECSGITDFGATPESLLTSVTLANGSSYSFSYELTQPQSQYSGMITGRIQQITLPTGGSISYTYTDATGQQSTQQNYINCGDGSAAGLIRTTSDGQGVTGEWQYTRSAGPPASTTITDPQNNQTVIDFQGIYETERKTYSGTAGGTPLMTVDTCYNLTLTSVPYSGTCTGTSVTTPGNRAVRTTLAGSTSSAEVFTIFNNSGQVTETDEYNWGLALTRKTVYGSYTDDQPGSVTICSPGGSSGSCATGTGGGTQVAQTTYRYDSNGNLQTASAGGLTRGYQYNSNGTVSMATDVNTGQTNYYYTGTGGCSSAFPTSVSEPMSLSRSMTWDCYTGLMTSLTDENGKTTQLSYTDPLLQLTKVTDPTAAVTNISYCVVNCAGGFPASESNLTFNNGSSVYDFRSSVDGLGRPVLSQQQNGPNSNTYDTVETTYDSVGRPSTVTMPYNTTAGGTDPTNYPLTTTYDALSRPVEVLDSYGGYTTYSYNANDVLKTVGPAPGGTDHKKQWQYQHDALGRLTYVCEVTGATGSASCQQTTPASGFMTSYIYDVLNDVIEVVQNNQAGQSQWQTRTYQYDSLGRMTQETNPESGTTYYTYDLDPTCGTSNGDLVKKVDAVGAVICYAYDQLHRLTAQTQSRGPYSTAPRYYVYDNATVNGVAMGNAEGRLAEACTGGSPGCTGSKITDLGFEYSGRGEITNTFTWTSQSGGWYHVCETYYQKPGLPKVLNLYGNADTECNDSQAQLIPTITDGVGGEGRISSVSASGQNPVTGVTYNYGGQVKTVSYGSGDSDTFSYDLNTGRMTQYQFNVGSNSMAGALTWNQNGTLQQLAITDPFNSADQQTCSYLYDDLARVSSANCGSIWTQTFSPDVFGNLTYTGSNGNFQPGYSSNQITLSGFSYDLDGNLLTTGTGTGSNTYTWNGFGEMTSDTPSGGSTVGINYDALGRPAMTNVNGGSYTEFVYGPDGSKLALMNGQTLSKARVELPGGGLAIYNSTGLIRYWHPDWQGSIRLLTNPSQPTYYSSAAASPFGESYAENPAGAGALFAGLLGDTSSELNDALFREYNPVQGRWISPDPAGLAAVDLTNPQSLNRYAYVMNNPTTLIDPTGLKPCIGPVYSCVEPNLDNEPQGSNWFPGEDYPGGNDIELPDWQTYQNGESEAYGVYGYSDYNPGAWAPAQLPMYVLQQRALRIMYVFNTPQPPDNRPSCGSVWWNSLTDTPDPAEETAEQGAKTASNAAAQLAAMYAASRALVVPLRSPYFRLFTNAANILADVAEAAPALFITPDVIKADYQTAKANYNGECRPGF